MSIPLNLCIDTYNSRVTEKQIEERTCPKCEYYSITKKNNLKHKQLNVCGEFEEKECDHVLGNQSVLNLFDWLHSSQPISDNCIILDHKGSNRYLIEYEDETQEWISVESTHKLVMRYNEKLKSMSQTNEEIISVNELPAFLNFDRYTDLSDVDENDVIDNDLFADELLVHVESEKQNEREKRKANKIVLMPQLDLIEYKEGDKYYRSSDESSSDDDEPILTTKEQLSKIDRIKITKKMIPSLTKKKKKTPKKKKSKEKKSKRKKSNKNK